MEQKARAENPKLPEQKETLQPNEQTSAPLKTGPAKNRYAILVVS